MSAASIGFRHVGFLTCAAVLSTRVPTQQDMYTAPVFWMGKGDRRTKKGKVRWLGVTGPRAGVTPRSSLHNLVNAIAVHPAVTQEQILALLG